MAELAGNVTIVTGASRDIGAEIALEIARQGGHVVIGCNQREGRARNIATEIFDLSAGESFTEIVAADLTKPEGVEQLIAGALDLAERTHGQLAALVLNAAMGYGLSKDEAAELNLQGNLRLAGLFSDAAIAHDKLDRRDILYMTSHPSHLFGHPGNSSAVTEEYLPVAASKHDAELALRREFVNAYSYADRRLLVLSGDVVEGTTVAKMLGSAYRRATEGGNLLEARNRQMEQIVGATVPTKESFGAMAVRMLLNEGLPNGHIRFMPRPILEEGGVLRAASPADLSFGLGNNPEMCSFVS